MTEDMQKPQGRVELELTSTLYAEMRKIARARLRRLSPGQTLCTSEVVNEAWLRLREQSWEHRRHFLGAAARAMRFVLVEHIRRKKAQKRMGHLQRVDMEFTLPGDEAGLGFDEVLVVHDALEQLAQSHPVAAQVVELRFFGGLTMNEIAEVTGLGRGALNRKWQFARAWLSRAIDGPRRAAAR